MSIFNITCYSLSAIIFILAFVFLFLNKNLKKEEKSKAFNDVIPTVIYRLIFFLGVII